MMQDVRQHISYLIGISITDDNCVCLMMQDVGQAILESYSRVLESLAFNIVSWIDDVLFADKSARES